MEITIKKENFDKLSQDKENLMYGKFHCNGKVIHGDIKARCHLNESAIQLIMNKKLKYTDEISLTIGTKICRVSLAQASLFHTLVAKTSQLIRDAFTYVTTLLYNELTEDEKRDLQTVEQEYTFIKHKFFDYIKKRLKKDFALPYQLG